MASDDANKLCVTRSYFKKTVSLRDWWLTKPQTDDDTKALGVAGLSTSQQSRAGRCFSSAPILKVYDLFELETVDGVCIILQGFINKDRTLESGFSSEVFNHFVIGFPPYWAEFSTSCPKRRSATEHVLRDVAGKDNIDVHGTSHDSAHGKLLHHDSCAVDMGVQVLSNKTSNVHDASSLMVSKKHMIKDGHEVTCERSPLTSEFDVDPSLMVSPVSSRRVTRSMTKMDGCKNRSVQGSLLHDISSLNKFTTVDLENLESSKLPMNDINDALSDNKATNAVNCDGPNLLHAGTGLRNTVAEREKLSERKFFL